MLILKKKSFANSMVILILFFVSFLLPLNIANNMNTIVQNSEQNEPNQLSTLSLAYDVLPLSNYIMEDSVSYNWIEISSSGTTLVLGDDDSVSISLPFFFPFYDSLFSTIYVSSNGWFSFNNSNPYHISYDTFPTVDSEICYAMGLFWDNLMPSGNIYYQTFINPNRIVIEYQNIETAWDTTAGSFEAILFENGTIIFQYDYIDDYSMLVVGLNYGLDDFFYNEYTDLSDSTDDLAIKFTYPSEDHDVLSNMDVPSKVDNDTTTIINVTIGNYGLNDESVSGDLYINNIWVAGEDFLLRNKTSETFSYDWTPTKIGIYNITSIADPVSGETYLANNIYTKFVEVAELLIEFELGDYICMNKSKLGESSKLWVNFTYDSFPDPSHVIITNNTLLGPWIDVDIYTRKVISGGIEFIGENEFYPGQIETDIDIGDTITYLDSNGIIEETVWYDWDGIPLEAWKINLDSMGVEAYHHKETGVWLYYNNKMTKEEYFMVNTSLISHQRPDHDLFIALEHRGYFPPGETTQLTALVYNWGLNTETGFLVSFWINDVEVSSETLGPLTSGSIVNSYYSWTPGVIELGINNLTVSVTTVLGESRITDNKQTEFVSVHEELISFDLMDSNKLYNADFDQWYNYTYESILPDSHHVNVSTGYGSWLIVNLFTRLVTNSSSDLQSIFYNNTYYPSQIETSVSIGDIINFIFFKGKITKLVWFEWNNRLYEAWRIDMNYDILPMFAYFHKDTGICVYMCQGKEPMITETVLYETNMIDVYDHDIQVFSQVPLYISLDETINLQCEVANYGKYAESAIIIEYWIEEVMVYTTTIPSLTVLKSTIISYDWTPSTKGTFNITIIAIPVADETYVKNNNITTMVIVAIPMLKFDIGDYMMMTNGMTIIYDHFIDNAHINVTFFMGASPAWVLVDIYTRLVEDVIEGGEEMFLDQYWFAQIETDISIDDLVQIFMYNGLVEETIFYDWNSKLIEAWNVSITPDMFGYFHKKTGILLYYFYGGQGMGIVDTNMINSPIITVTSPNGGETLEGIVPITWVASDLDGDPLTYTIHYTTGTSWVQLVSGITTISYSWDTLSVADGSSYKIRVIASDGELTTEDESDATFTIDQPKAPQITLTYPNGGETLSGSITIAWGASDPNGDPLTFTIYYTTGAGWTQIATGITTTSYSWDTTSVADGSSYKICVIASDGELTTEDESDATFTIDQPKAPQITLTYPNGGETLSGSITIAWGASDPNGDPLTFTIYYTTGAGWTQIATGITTTNYSWDTTSVADGSSYKICVIASDGELTTEDESDATFTINNIPSGSTTTTTTTTITTTTITTTTKDEDGPGFEIIMAFSMILILGLISVTKRRKSS